MMSANRADPFAEVSDLDLSDFAKPEPAKKRAVPKEAVKEVARDHRFTGSREAPAAAARKPQRRFTTGRNVQFNAKIDQATYDKLYGLLDRLSVPHARPATLGEVLERAVAALEAELDGQKPA